DLGARTPQCERPRRRKERRRALDDRLPTTRLALPIAHGVVRRGAEKNGGMYDLVHHARAERALRRQLPRGQDHVERARQTDETRKSPRPAGCRNEPEPRPGEAPAKLPPTPPDACG